MDAKTLALYLGCHIKFEIVNYHFAQELGITDYKKTYELTTAMLAELNRDEGEVMASGSIRFKLLLRPLSSITEEDAYQIENEMRKISPSFKFNGGSHFDNVELFEMSSILNLLRSKSFDCDGLIEKGEAIDATKLAS